MQTPTLGYFKNKNIIHVRKLTQKEFDDFEKSYEQLNKYMRSKELLVMVLLNHDDFFNALKQYFDIFKEKQDIGTHNLERIVLDLNRKILNYLGSVRTFLDHNETNVKRNYGEKEIEYFKTLTANHYDNSLAYRFLNRLRNYTQHCGLPIGNLILEAEKNIKVREGKNITVSLVFDRDALLTRFDGWGPIKKELQVLPPSFAIAPFLEEMMLRIGDINLCLMGELFPNIEQDAGLMMKLKNEINIDNSRAVILDYIQKSTTNSQLTFKELPIVQATWVLEDLAAVNA